MKRMGNTCRSIPSSNIPDSKWVVIGFMKEKGLWTKRNRDKKTKKTGEEINKYIGTSNLASSFSFMKRNKKGERDPGSSLLSPTMGKELSISTGRSEKYMSIVGSNGQEPCHFGGLGKRGVRRDTSSFAS